MSDPVESFRSKYASEFEGYLQGGGETGLESAYELGREAVRGELGLLDLAGIHHAVLADSLRGSTPGDAERVSTAAADFFLESLSTFEMTQRGFREAQETAIENARLYEHERDIAVTLQRNLLPASLPEISGVTAAVRYLAGGDGVEVGGDWYELIALPGQRAGFAIGDVVGRGVRAASVMGQLRVALHAYALESEGPSEVARRVANFVEALHEDQMTTCVYLVLDPADGSLRFANAGHPPPLLLAPDGSVTLLEGGGSPPLGAFLHPDYEEASFQLEPGSTVLLYTDGLVEKRGEPINVGLERLRTAVIGGPFDPEALCDRVLEALVEGAHGDDVALLALHYELAGGDGLDLTLAADASTLMALRGKLRGWLAQVGANEEESRDIVLAACEAAANAIEHAYGPGEAEIRFTASVETGEVIIEVRDFGSWREPRDNERGRGLGVMRESMDGVEVVRSDQGTNVQLVRKLRGGA